MFMLRPALVAVLALAGLAAQAADIRAGTQPDHEFTVQWGPCYGTGGPPAGVVGRLIDRQGGDIAREEFRVIERIGLGSLACRPAVVTLRLGKVSHRRVYVPALE